MAGRLIGGVSLFGCAVNDISCTLQVLICVFKNPLFQFGSLETGIIRYFDKMHYLKRLRKEALRWLCLLMAASAVLFKELVSFTASTAGLLTTEVRVINIRKGKSAGWGLVQRAWKSSWLFFGTMVDSSSNRRFNLWGQVFIIECRMQSSF